MYKSYANIAPFYEMEHTLASVRILELNALQIPREDTIAILHIM